MSRIKHIIEKMTLKQRLIILIILVILLPVLVSSYTTIIYSKNIIQEESVVMAKNTVNQISQNIDTMLEGNVDSISRMLMYDNRLYEFMVNKKDYSGHQKAIDEVLLSGTVLTQYVSTYDEIKIAALLGANGQFFNITFPPADSSAVIRKVKEMADIPKEQNFVIKWHPLQDNFFSNTPSRNVREQNIIVATRAIFQPATGEYLGIIIFAIYEKAIFSKYSSVQLGETGEISIVDKEGNLISHGNETKIRESNLDNDLIKRVLASNGNHFFINKDGQQMLVVTSKSEMNDWITIGTVPLNEISGKVNKVYSIVFLIMFISFVAAGTVVAFLADGIVKPIRKIIRAMEKVEGGDLTVRVNIQGQYEVSNLAQYFNSMISRINQLIEEEYKLEKRKKEAELYALMAQINPHFLYNTLESMVWKAQSMGAYEISSMASALGRLFRISVNKGNVTISVNEELEHVKCYIDIQKIRYKDRFEFILDVPDEKVKNYLTLKLLLQPIVENAFLHGIETMNRKGLIKVRAFEDQEKLIFEVTDNGRGISENALKELENKLFFNRGETEQKLGIGLKNVHERIQLYFGDSYGLKISSHENEGTLVSITIPLIMENKNKETT